MRWEVLYDKFLDLLIFWAVTLLNIVMVLLLVYVVTSKVAVLTLMYNVIGAGCVVILIHVMFLVALMIIKP